MKRQHGSQAIRVAVAAPFPEIVRIHESTAEYADEIEVCAMISSPEAVLDQARLLQPDVLLLSEELGATRHDTLARLGVLAPATRLVMLIGREPGGPPVIADGLVQLDAPPAELRAAIVAAMARGIGNQAPPAHSRDESSDAVGAVGSPADASPADGHADHPENEPSRIVLVVSGKGGVGKSVVATNLATALAARGARVALIDLDLQFGDVGLFLHLEAHAVTIDALAERDDIDEAALDRALATSADGVRVLLAPTSPEASDLVSASSLATILTLLSRTHDFVVVDSPAQLEERIVRVMEVADQILLVSSFGIASVKDTRVTLRLLQSLGIEPDRVAVVVNQTHPRISFPADEIERALRFPILSNLPFERRMDESLDSGHPLVVSEPRSRFSRQLAHVVDHVGRTRETRSTNKVARHGSKWRLRFGR
ncbi:MAG: P-loop NTPase [Actinomycetota bacterium]|nr:P-loop NTPase [Actinomycetota bacterium]